MMFHRVFAAALAVAVSTLAAPAATLHESDFGEFGDTFNSPTDFTGYNRIVGASNGQEDFEYFRFDSLLAGTTNLDFSFTNTGGGANMLIRLSATPFTMAEWDWTIDEFVAHDEKARELYANQWTPEDSYSFLVPDEFDGPVYGFARFYSVNSESTFAIDAIGAQAGTDMTPVPVPGALALMLAGLGAFSAVAWTRRKLP